MNSIQDHEITTSAMRSAQYKRPRKKQIPINNVVSPSDGNREPSMTDRHAIQDILSQYVRATDQRAGDAQTKLFADNGMIRFFGRSGTEEYQLAGEPVIGAERIRRHTKEFFPPRP